MISGDDRLDSLHIEILVSARVDEEEVVLDFGIKGKLAIHQSQSCCENRYFRTDDDPSQLRGSLFLGMEVRNVDVIDDDNCDVHEVGFMHINTSLGSIVVEAHNEHNGYYGGIWPSFSWSN